jgi:hypothetical protein
MQRKRYEMLLPLKYNDGRPMEDEKILDTREELVSRFDAISVSPGSVQGIWIHEGVRYEDDTRRITIDVDDLPENREFFVKFKALLCERFEQVEIYIVSHALDRI